MELYDPLHADEDIDGEEDAEEHGSSATATAKSGRLSRRQKRQIKEKAKKLERQQQAEPPSAIPSRAPPAPRQQQREAVEIEYVTADPAAQLAALGGDAADLQQFLAVFKKLSAEPESEEGASAADEGPSSVAASEPSNDAAAAEGDADGADAEKGDGDEPRLSRRAQKKLQQLAVADLKGGVAHPEVVEVQDVRSGDPKLLVFLKAARNSVPVPRHWCHKRKYLQGKRGVEKPPFVLPDFITATGITKMRNSDVEKTDEKSLKSKTRERFAPKMGKIEIDYEVLHDAFFKFQTKPPLSKFGDTYYEGREFEAKAHTAKPGQLSAKLREALGMEGGIAPPPWLIGMQRYGPPPSYPGLRIPGLSAPLPPGASYGFHPGGWGKPPVDAYGRPLYGDVFGTSTESSSDGSSSSSSKAPRALWGEPGAAAGGTSGSGGAGGQPEDVEGVIIAPPEEAPAPLPPPLPPSAPSLSGTMTPMLDGTMSVPLSISGMSGIETPDFVDLRKGGARGAAAASAAAPAAAAPSLYTVLPEKRTGLTGSLLGTTHAYIVPAAGSASQSAAQGGGAGSSSASSAAAGAAAAAGSFGGSSSGEGGGVAVTINPDELGALDEAALAKKYETELAATKVREGL